MGLGFNKGQETYTVTGSPTITAGGVVSEFSSTDYLTFPNWTDEGYDLEFCLTFLLPQSYVPGSRPMNQIGSGGTWSSYFEIASYQSGLSYRIKSGESLSISYSLQNETKYIAKLVRQAGTYTLYLLDEQKNILATSTSLQTSTLIGNGSPALVRIGYESSVYGNGFPGEIYLQDQTYLKVNGEYWFTGFREITGVQYRAEVGYTVVGSTTITDGVASGFSNSDYLKTSNSFNPSTNSWELVCSFIYKSGSRGLFGSSVSADYQGVTLVFNSNKLRWCLSSNGSSWDIVGARTVGNELQNDIKYKVKITYNGSLYSLYLATGNNDYVLIDSQASSTPIFVSSGGLAFGNNYIYNGANQYFYGEIDLNETYIKVNGKLWFWQPRPCTKVLYNGVQVWPDIPRYNVGTPSFLMRFDGSWNYYSDGNLTAELVNSPSLTTGGPWGLGALDQTYYAADTSVRKAVQVNMTAAQQTSQSFFIEYWARLDNTDQSIYQTFLGNLIHPDTTYSGWAFRWWPRTGGNISILDMFAGNGSSTVHHYNQLGYNQVIPGNTQQEWINCCEAVKNNWCHYGVYFNKQNTRVQFYINGRCFYEQSTTVYDTALGNAQPNFYISNAKYGTGYTLSPMAEVRVLLGQNADDYATTIQTGTHTGGYGTFDYTVPTASFADGGLTQYTAS